MSLISNFALPTEIRNLPGLLRASPDGLITELMVNEPIRPLISVLSFSSEPPNLKPASSTPSVTVLKSDHLLSALSASGGASCRSSTLK